MPKNLTVLHFFLALLLLALAGSSACAPSGDLPTPQGDIRIDEAVVRLPPGGAMAGMGSEMSLAAGYMRIRNTGSSDDALVGIRADFSGKSMLHKSSVDANGVASMKMVMSIDVPAGQTLELKQGSFHAMFEDLKQELKAGDTVTLVLQFRNAGEISVAARVMEP